MSNSNEVHMLWVDDQIKDLGQYIKALEETGIIVHAAVSAEEALYKAQIRTYDIIVTDLLMPPPDGIEFLRKVFNIQKKSSYAIFSSYLYIDKYRVSIKELGFPIKLIDKDFPPIGASDFEGRFLKPFVDLLESKKKRKNVIKKIIEAAEVKPGWAGISIDLKKLLTSRD